MSLDELLSIEKEQVGYSHFRAFVEHKEIKNVTKEDLDKIIDKFGFKVFEFVNFNNLYNMKITEKTERTMGRWTKAVGIMTGIMTVMTLVVMVLTYMMYVK